MIRTIFSAIAGFVIFLYVGLFFLGYFWPELPYEKALSYLLSMASIGSIAFGYVAYNFPKKRSNNRSSD